ncbi:60S ribosomal protein L36-3 [Artemisia annua]|uniref:60S ribosomal protein L36 n=1 Tax=Artemisia annua TaxID=35608 RepID=A0A2U1QBR2_ARTAN|nr:60S ribosomal protein L36-3 [Artemisia annua]
MTYVERIENKAIVAIEMADKVKLVSCVKGLCGIHALGFKGELDGLGLDISFVFSRDANEGLFKAIMMAMAPKQPNTGLFVGLNKGHIVTKKELAPRPSDRKGKTSKRVHFVRNLVREVAGFAPYERRIIELIRVGKDKRALKVAKRKLGTHKRAKKKREEISTVLRKTRSGGAEKKK